MKQEWRNLKGEIVRVTGHDDDGNHWWHPSASTLILLFGFILFNIGCFTSPTMFAWLYWQLDLRLWPWWYFPIAFAIIGLSVSWFIIYLKYDDYDDIQTERAKRYLRFSIYLSGLGILFLIIRPFFFMRQVGYALSEWFRSGNFSFLAFVSFVVIIALVFPAIYFAKEWLISLFGDY